MSRIKLALALAAVLLFSMALAPLAAAKPDVPTSLAKPHVTRQHERPGRLGVASTVGGVLTATTSANSWTGSPSTYTYEWQDCNSTATTCTTISGSTLITTALTDTYTIQTSDVGYYIRVGVQAANSSGPSAWSFSSLTAQITSSGGNPVNTSMPSLAGSPIQGATITLTPGTFSNETSQDGTWEDCPTATSTSCTSTNPGGGTSYTLQTSDPVGDYLRLMEVATNTNGTTTVWSNAIGPITASTGGYTGTCTRTINPNTSPGYVASQEASMAAGQVLCLNSGTYGTTTTPSDCAGSDYADSYSDCNVNIFKQGGSSGQPITITSAPGQVATIQGGMEIEASYITLENVNLDLTNQISATTNSAGTATAVPPCTTMNKAQAIQLADGFTSNYVTIQDNNIYESNASEREIGIFVGPTGGGATGLLITHNNFSDFGSCDQTLHEIYDDSGVNNTITQNWFWGDQYGYGVQFFPSDSSNTVTSNVFDGMLDCFVTSTSGGGDNISHNVCINPVANNAITSYNTQSFAGGSFMSCYKATSGEGAGGTTETIANNAVYNGNYACTSEAEVAFSNNITLSANPFVNSTGHNYQLCATGNGSCTSGQITAAGQVSGYGLWNGSGPPSPDPQPASLVAPHRVGIPPAMMATFAKPVSPYEFLTNKRARADQARVDRLAAKANRARLAKAEAKANAKSTSSGLAWYWWALIALGVVAALTAVAAGVAVRRRQAA